jgi:hypothetical protein
MRSRVLVHGIDPAAPAEAAREAVASALSALPPARSLLVGVVAWGDGPGLEPARWTLQGVRAAARDAKLVAGYHDLGPHHASVTGRWLRAHPDAIDGDAPRPITLEVAGARRPRRIPRGWIGRHLCLVVPCVHQRHERFGRSKCWVGPMACALQALAQATGVPGDDEPTDVGARVAAQVFASTTVVIDASWWAPMRASQAAAPHLVALDRCLVLGTTAPAELWTQDGATVIDTWLAARMGVAGPPPRNMAVPQWVGPAAADAWPRPPAAARRNRGLAGQAIDALWRVGDLGRAKASAATRRLPPAVPGALARHWHPGTGTP